MESEHELPTAAFNCALCGRPAGWVMLLEPGVLNPEPGDAPPGVAEMFIDEPRVLYSATRSRIESPISVEQARSLAPAIRQHRASAIVDAVPDGVLPLYCRQCDKIYCPAHWKVDVHMDSSMPNQIDDITGTCPEGHYKILEDRPM